jgi:hypothetical protein
MVTTSAGTCVVPTGRRRVSYCERDALRCDVPDGGPIDRDCLVLLHGSRGCDTRDSDGGPRGRSERIEGAASSPPSRRSRTRRVDREFRCSGISDRGGEASLNWAVGADAEICALVGSCGSRS